MVSKEAVGGRAVSKEAVSKRAVGKEAVSGTQRRGSDATSWKARKPVRNIEKHIEKELRRAVPAIFDAMVTEAVGGDVPAAKVILQLSKENAAEAKARGKRGGVSLSELLMDELKRRQDEREAKADLEQRQRAEMAGGQAEGAASGHAEAG